MLFKKFNQLSQYKIQRHTKSLIPLLSTISFLGHSQTETLIYTSFAKEAELSFFFTTLTLSPFLKLLDQYICTPYNFVINLVQN